MAVPSRRRAPGQRSARPRASGLMSPMGRKWFGFAAWFFVSGCVYWFFELVSPVTKFASSAFFTLVTPATDEPHAAWAGASHAAGLALFLVIYTRQSRWVIATAAGWLVMLWGIGLLFPEDWRVLAAHLMGYAILAGCVVTALGVFGGVVWLWTELLEFVKRMVVMYPEVKKDLSGHPLLEKVVVRGPRALDLADMASISSCQIHSCSFPTQESAPSASFGLCCGGSSFDCKRCSPYGADFEQQSTQSTPRASFELPTWGPEGQCFLCKGKVVATLPVCSNWVVPVRPGVGGTLSVCTPFAALKAERSRLQEEVARLTARLQEEGAARQQAERDLATREHSEWANPVGPLSHQLPNGVWQAVLLRERAARQAAEAEAMKRGLEALDALAEAGAEAAARAAMEARALKAEAELQAKLDIMVSQLAGADEHAAEDAATSSSSGPSEVHSVSSRKLGGLQGKAKREIKRLLEEVMERELQLQTAREELAALHSELKRSSAGA